MVDSINIPKDLSNVIEVKVVDKSAPLRRFLADLLVRVEKLEKSNIDLAKKVEALNGSN